jgi:acyl carrier protein phosphodiesterase
MNFLAHFYLAGEDAGLLIGNFIADAVKGSALNAYPEAIRRGIVMHRNIDHFTDTHPLTAQSKNLLREEFNHYSGVIVDVFYDHFLAKNWAEFHSEPFPDYTQRIYRLLELNSTHFPERPKLMLPFMKQHDWLMAYSGVEGIRRVMTGMSQRVRHDSKMEYSADALLRNYDEFEAHFRAFFPELVAHTDPYRR